ncbi:MAG: hypothetical protein AAB589_00830 [Patescibacteria group bacterium]
MKKLNYHNGFMALMAVLVLGGGTLLLALSSSYLGLAELESSNLETKAGQALVAADGCLDETLRRLRLNPAYTGGSLTLGDASCIITVTGSGTKTIMITATLGQINKKIQVTASLTGNVINQPITWTELAN